jgi:hypothetical protein
MRVERAVHGPDYSPDLAWQLCGWCHERGAQTFALDIIGTAPRGDAVYANLGLPISPFALPTGECERLTAMPGQEYVRATERWSLTMESLHALPSLFPRGPFDYPFGTPAWCEDLTFYRDGKLLLGIVSHESWGLLRVTDIEAAQLAAAGFPTHDPTDRVQ